MAVWKLVFPAALTLVSACGAAPDDAAPAAPDDAAPAAPEPGAPPADPVGELLPGSSVPSPTTPLPSSASAEPDDASNVEPVPEPVPTISETLEPTGCSAPLPPGDHALTLEHGGVTRAFDVHIPASADLAVPVPVVLYFHPLLTNKEYLKGAGAIAKSDREGFIAVFPDGIGGSWNGGACCGPANGADGSPPVDDVGFVRGIVEALTLRSCVDTRRIYATGFSNGGFLSHRLACEAADMIAAIAPVSAVSGLPPTTCQPARPVPVMQINGTSDTLVPYGGGFALAGVTNGAFVGVLETFHGWSQLNRCAGEPVETLSRGTTSCLTFADCAGDTEVTQCTVEGGGHCWFGEPLCVFGTNTGDVLATDATWDFLRRFRL